LRSPHPWPPGGFSASPALESSPVEASHAPTHETHPHATPPHGKYLALMCLGALGVVYGDIGTSPLYAVRECLNPPHGVPALRENVFGVLSLIFWSLIVVVTLKYHVYVLRLDNRGEGGILALMGLIRLDRQKRAAVRWILAALGVFGAALLYGDGIITPAISVLSAIEGLSVATPFFDRFVVPITIAILLGLFLFQRHGTGRVGAVFGPVMLVWFSTLALLGISWIVREPAVLAAVNPAHAVRFFTHNGFHGFLVLGLVFLVATGGEALYADLGHFGERPIQVDWFFMVGPCLLLNYFGQGALVLRNPAAVDNPFYRLAPASLLYPLVILSTAATIIASQAVISGAFSLTRQAVQLGYLPRVQIDHTSSKEIGQIYISSVNWALAAATIALVIGFRSSSNLAAAYGVAVTTTMVITTGLAYFVSRDRWGKPLALAVTIGFLFADLAFFSANIVKVAHGGWFPLLVAIAVFTVMTTWRTGRRILQDRIREGALSDELFLNDILRRKPPRVAGTAVFMDRTVEGIPLALLHNLKHNKVLHEKVILLTVETREIPYVPDEEEMEIRELGQGLYRVILRYGFMESPDVPEALRRLDHPDLHFDESTTTFFLGRETLLATKRPGMAIWRERMFSWMTRNAQGAPLFFRLPPNRVVELGAQIEL
jgi:KUP system potassium uptake protein